MVSLALGDLMELKPFKNLNLIHQDNMYNHVGRIQEIYKNDVNKQPSWLPHFEENTEFYLKRNKKNILINIGESWAYGESLEPIATALKKFDFSTQINQCVGARLAVSLDADLYQYAVPGNCNFYMQTEFERIAQYVSTLKYDNVYVAMQVTEPGREESLSHELTGLWRKIYAKNQGKDFQVWVKEYDEICFKHYNQTLQTYLPNANAILWKNFCKTCTDFRYDSFKVIEKSWIQYSADMYGIDLEMPEFYSVGWYDGLFKNHISKLKINKKYSIKQLDIIEKSNKMISNHHIYHRPHPTQESHLLWSQYLLHQSGWINKRKQNA